MLLRQAEAADVFLNGNPLHLHLLLALVQFLNLLIGIHKTLRNLVVLLDCQERTVGRLQYLLYNIIA